MKITIISLFCYSIIFSQDLQGTREYTDTIKVEPKINKKIEYLEGYGLNYCINNNYRRINFESILSFNDYSSLEFEDNGNLKENTLENLRNFIIEKTSSYYQEGSTYYSERGVPNLIFYKCYNFYKSKEFVDYIKKLTK